MLSSGLSFADLSFNKHQIYATVSHETLAILLGVDTVTLTQSDFVVWHQCRSITNTAAPLILPERKAFKASFALVNGKAVTSV